MIGTVVKRRWLGNSKVYKDRKQSSFLVNELLKLKKNFSYLSCQHTQLHLHWWLVCMVHQYWSEPKGQETFSHL